MGVKCNYCAKEITQRSDLIVARDIGDQNLVIKPGVFGIGPYVPYHVDCIDKLCRKTDKELVRTGKLNDTFSNYTHPGMVIYRSIGPGSFLPWTSAVITVTFLFYFSGKADLQGILAFSLLFSLTLAPRLYSYLKYERHIARNTY